MEKELTEDMIDLSQVTPWDTAEIINTPEMAAAYIEAYLEDGTEEEVFNALKTIARSKAMVDISKKMGRRLKEVRDEFSGGTPCHNTVKDMLSVLGFAIDIVPIKVSVKQKRKDVTTEEVAV
jgi:probable addiction module antidote protein